MQTGPLADVERHAVRRWSTVTATTLRNRRRLRRDHGRDGSRQFREPRGRAAHGRASLGSRRLAIRGYQPSKVSNSRHLHGLASHNSAFGKRMGSTARPRPSTSTTTSLDASTRATTPSYRMIVDRAGLISTHSVSKSKKSADTVSASRSAVLICGTVDASPAFWRLRPGGSPALPLQPAPGSSREGGSR